MKNMRKLKQTTEKTLNALLSGVHPLVKKYGGRQVFVVEDKVVPLGTGQKALAGFKRLKAKYGKSPVLVFVPRPGASYILVIL